MSRYSDLVLSDKPVSYWRFDDSGSTADDIGSYNWDGTFTNCAMREVGLVAGAGHSVKYNGTSSMMKMVGSKTYDPSGNIFSVEAWFKTDTPTGSMSVFNQSGGAGSGFCVKVDSNGTLQAASHATQNIMVSPAGYIVSGVIYHVVWVKNGSSNKMYVNGDDRSADFTITDYTFPANGAGDSFVGCSSDGVSQWWKGWLDEVAIYMVALTRDQVVRHYRIGNPSAYRDSVLRDAPLGYWRLGEASGTNANDEVGSLDGTYVNTPTLGVAGALTGDADTAATFARASTEYVSTAAGTGIPVGNALRSVEFWMKAPGALNSNAAVGWGSSNQYQRFVVGYSGSPASKLWMHNGDAEWFFGADGAPTDGSWHHCVFVLESATSLRAYMDGVDLGAQTTTTINTVLDGAYVSIAGDNHWSGGATFEGSLDEVAIYASALTAAQIADHYAAGVGKYGPAAPSHYAALVLADSPVAYWRLNEANWTDFPQQATTSGSGDIRAACGWLAADFVARFHENYSASVSFWATNLGAYLVKGQPSAANIRQTARGVSNSGSTLVVTLPQATRPGNTIVVFAASSGLESNIPTVVAAHDTLTKRDSNAQTGIAVFHFEKFNAVGGDTVVTITFSGSVACTATVIELADVNVNPLDSYNGSSGASSLPGSSGDIQTVAANVIVLSHTGWVPASTAASVLTPGRRLRDSADGDYSGLNVNPTLGGGGGAIAGDPATAINFNGDSYGDIQGTNLPMGASARSAEAWVKVAGGTNPILLYGTGSAEQWFVFAVVNGQLVAGFYGDDHTFGPAGGLSDGDWHHVAVTFAGTTVRGYIDGQEASGSPQSTGAVNTVAGLHWLGTDGTYSASGWFQEIAVYGYVLSPGQILSHYRRGVGSRYAAVILADSPVAYWRLGEASGTVAIDEIGSYHATYTGGYALAQSGSLTGDANKAVRLTTGHVVSIGKIVPLLDCFSIEAWLNSDTPGTGVYLCGESGTGFSPSLVIGEIANRISCRVDGFGRLATNTFDLSAGVWYHVVWTKNGAQNDLYINGVRDTPVWTNTTCTALTGGGDTFLGCGGDGLDNFPGMLDEFAFYTYALSAAQVAAHYNVGKGKFGVM